MILVHAIFNFALKQGSSSDLVCASISFYNEYITWKEPPSFKLLIRDFKVTYITCIDPITLNMGDCDVTTRVCTWDSFA